MTFPDSPRVIYDRNPLIQVICQVRFSPVLKIDAEPPAGFQERIRESFPLFKEKDPAVDLPPEIPDAVRELLARVAPKQGRRAYEFISEDESWTVGLTRDFLALSTSKYQRWEEFGGKLQEPIQALLDVYRPQFFTRVGLRYRNIIRLSALNLSDVPWSDLLRPPISGIFSVDEIGDVEESKTQMLIRMNGDLGKVRINHGIVKADDDSEECYLIDNDFFTDTKTGTQDATATLDQFNRESGRLFRWCIEDRLHDAMGPRPAASAA